MHRGQPCTSEPAADAFLADCKAAGRAAGVTRLANITGLDRLGLPVWQAVRPASRALSVHQGKGASDTVAQIGALCEALESHCAEQAQEDGPWCASSSIDPAQRALELGDYCRRRDAAPSEVDDIQWCLATDLLSGDEVCLPHHVVSLDYTRGLPSLFERTSDGLGAGPTEEQALLSGLREVIERDGVGEWQRLSQARRENSRVDVATIPFDRFRGWRERLESLGIDLHLFEVATVIGMPAFHCEIGGSEEFGTSYRRFSGTAAHEVAEVALFKAFAEAVQSRLTVIAGVRDDILPSYYRESAKAAAPAAKSPAAPGRPWRDRECAAASVASVAEELAAEGYRQIAAKRLSAGLSGVEVHKVFVPGLGSLTRTRRAVPCG